MIHPLWIEVGSSIVAIEADVTNGVDVEPVQSALQSAHFPVDPHVANPLFNADDPGDLLTGECAPRHQLHPGRRHSQDQCCLVQKNICSLPKWVRWPGWSWCR